MYLLHFFSLKYSLTIASRILHTCQGISCQGSPNLTGKIGWANLRVCEITMKLERSQNTEIQQARCRRTGSEETLLSLFRRELRFTLSLHWLFIALKGQGYQLHSEPNRQMSLQLLDQIHKDSPSALHWWSDLSWRGNGESFGHLLHAEWRVCLRR